MAKVNICNVVVKDNPCPFRHPFQFEITFECIENLNEGGIPAYKCICIFIAVALLFVKLVPLVSAKMHAWHI